MLLILGTVPLLISGYMTSSLAKKMVMHEKGAKLISYTKILDANLGAKSFNDILATLGAEEDTKEEKIRLLSGALQDVTDNVSASVPGLGVGCYSLDLDAIITYGPSAEYSHTIGMSIPPEHPGRTVMKNAEPMVIMGSMVRGEIMNAMTPLIRNDKVIGYLWANELSTDIEEQIGEMNRQVVFAALLCLGLCALLLFIFSRRVVADIANIITGVKAMRSDLSQRIHNTGGEFAEVASNINSMAAEIEKATEENKRVLAVMETVMGNVEVAISVCEPSSKTIVFANRYLRKLRNITAERMKLPCYTTLYGYDSVCPNCPQTKLFAEDGTPNFRPIYREEHDSVHGRDFLYADRLITWHDGRILHMQIATDITERNALVMAEAANRAQKDFLARMSHEIRTPMNGVLGMAHLAIQADPPPVQLGYLKKIQSSAALLLGIINDILDFSRIEAGKITIENRPFNLMTCIENIRELILPRVQERDLTLDIDIAPEVPQFVMGDELRLSQILLNLLGNASKFTLEGSVGLSVKAKAMQNGKFKLHCEVKDSGIGMSADQIEALFKPFSQADVSTSRRFGGTGLGLSICKALVELMGGQIGVTSIEGTGSTFAFDIELEETTDVAQPEEYTQKAWENASYTGRNFLLVEDNLINQEIALAVLEELGATTDVAANGQEAVDAFMKGNYDLIFMDVRMPVMDGIEATKIIRASGKENAGTIPIIAMTANAMQEDKDMCTDAGMNAHVAKPLDVADLKSVIYKMLA